MCIYDHIHVEALNSSARESDHSLFFFQVFSKVTFMKAISKDGFS